MNITTSRRPYKSLFKKWAESTPHKFRFAIKVPKHITQDIIKLGDFLEELAPLEEKTLAVVIESLTILGNNGREWLDDISRTCTYHGFSVAFEFKHPSWFQDLTYNLLNKHKAAVVWSESSSRCSYPVVTADFLYLRINEESSGEKWVSKLKEKVSESNNVNSRARNNNYQKEEELLDTANGPKMVVLINKLIGDRDREIAEYRKTATTTYEANRLKEPERKPESELKPNLKSKSNRKLDEWMK
jgi:uncharacterized protein YecE (DUF72 family)